MLVARVCNLGFELEVIFTEILHRHALRLGQQLGSNDLFVVRFEERIKLISKL